GVVAENHGHPTRVQGLQGVTGIALGREHSCALAGGRVYCWGAGDRGQLGLGTTRDAPTPTVVPGLEGVRQIAAGADHSCALLGDHELRCWGTAWGLPNQAPETDQRTPAVISW